MALTAATKKRVASLLKIKEADLETALKDEKEVDLAIAEDIEVFTKEELETRDKTQQNEGIKAGKEIGIKEVRKAAGIEEGGSKDPAKVAEAITAKVAADLKLKPDEKVTQLTDQVNLLQKQLSEKDAAIETANKTASEAALDRRILAAFPKDRSSALEDDEYLTLIKATYQFKQVDGKDTIEKGGQVLRDAKTTNPLDLNAAVGSIFSERKGWKGEAKDVPGGRGGNDGKPTAGFTKMSELKEHFKSQGKSMLGDEFRDAVKQAADANKEFDMNA